ncbi:MAG TPA: hypothetical protein VGO68_22410 [Pyrinomonadaceae bacterium]|jgi:hypothetical protein|nr:hypothetical protein [Pyrinomonadaceae bacterium]
MSDKPSAPPKLTRIDLTKLLERIKENADARVPEVKVSDSRALEGQNYLIGVGEDWLRQEIRHTKHLHYVRLFLLAALFVLVLMWLFSVAALLTLQAFRVWDFNLSDKVIIAYITSTTVSVLGLFHIAAKWLFSASFADVASSIKNLHKK